MTAPAHTRVSRDDWIAAALASLETTSLDRLNVSALAGALSISRSSFYWYFDGLGELHAELLDRWTDNTRSIVERAGRDASTIVAAVLGVFECWADPRLYDARLDLAVRDWASRDPVVASRFRIADDERLTAVAAMFRTHGYGEADAEVRARLLYHSQVGYHAVGTDEPMATRLGFLAHYVESMTGVRPEQDELEGFVTFASALEA